jgi:alpha-methylacyl-CoA racemase
MPDPSTTPPAPVPGPLAGFRVVTIAGNVPGPVAASRLCDLGASVTKVEPPTGDPLDRTFRSYYLELLGAQDVLTLDLKTEDGLAELHEMLSDADVLITSHRRSALERLGLRWAALRDRHPRLSQVAIVGQRAPDDDVPGHDLTYQAVTGLLAGRPGEEPRMPTALIADLTGAERAVTEAVAAILQRERTGHGSYREVALCDAAEAMAGPLRHGLTGPRGVLGGSSAAYRIYPAATGHVACAALEAHFFDRLVELLGVDRTADALGAAFQERTADEWQLWGREHNLPLVAVVTNRGA